MNILINNIELPKEGHVKLLALHSDGRCIDEFGNVFKTVQIPPHYDLIDHNALKIAVMNGDCETRIDFLKHTMDCINKAPVVIPSDMPTYESEEGEI